jgi:hypothetical protein
VLRIRQDDYPTIKAAIHLTEPCFALQFETNVAFHKFRTKAAFAKALLDGQNAWIAGPSPAKGDTVAPRNVRTIGFLARTAVEHVRPRGVQLTLTC